VSDKLILVIRFFHHIDFLLLHHCLEFVGMEIFLVFFLFLIYCNYSHFINKLINYNHLICFNLQTIFIIFFLDFKDYKIRFIILGFVKVLSIIISTCLFLIICILLSLYKVTIPYLVSLGGYLILIKVLEFFFS